MENLHVQFVKSRAQMIQRNAQAAESNSISSTGTNRKTALNVLKALDLRV